MKLLLAAADSEDGERASTFVNAWLAREKRVLYVVHVIQAPGILSDLAQTIFTDWKQHAMKEARRLVERLAEPLTSRMSTARGVVLQGDAKAALLQFISDHGIQTTILAPHATSRAKRFLLGSVSEAILHHSPSSVFIVRPPRRTSKRRVVLIGLDGSANAQKAARYVLSLHLSPPSLIVLAYVEEPPDSLLDRMARSSPDIPIAIERAKTARNRRVRADMNRMEMSFKGRGYRVEQVIMEGPAAVQLLTLANRYHVDVIVLGCRGLSKFERYTLGSVSSKVARHAGCSVLVVK
jgi:nucleotide-binding universal stress UspA family protein